MKTDRSTSNNIHTTTTTTNDNNNDDDVNDNNHNHNHNDDDNNTNNIDNNNDTRSYTSSPRLCAADGGHQQARVYILQRGVQWKQGVVIRMLLYTILLYNTTPIHCTPLPTAPPCNEYPVSQKATTAASYHSS